MTSYDLPAPDVFTAGTIGPPGQRIFYFQARDGDTVVTSITGIGSFTLHVKDSAARSWQRGIDEEMAARQRAVASP